VTERSSVLVVGAGPAGVVATLRAARLGVRTTLVTSGAFGGMAANDGPIPVRTLAQAARLIREARQLDRYGIQASQDPIDYPRLLERVREVVEHARLHSTARRDVDEAGATVHEHTGPARFVDDHTIEIDDGRRFEADRIILCVGGKSRRLPIPGFELTATHSDAWSLTSVPPSIIVVGAGATGAQVASIFAAFGSEVHLFEAAPRILETEDEDVSALVAAAFRENGISIREAFGAIDRFEAAGSGVRMVYSKDDVEHSAEAAVVIVAVGWTADTEGLKLARAGVMTDSRGHVTVDEYLRTSAPHVFAAGDVTSRCGLASLAIQDGFVAGTNAVNGPTVVVGDHVVPVGSFTDPEYAHVGRSEAEARATNEVVVATVSYDSTPRPIIDGRTTGLCKLVVDRSTRTILGCHVVGERAVELAQIAAVAMTGSIAVDDFARLPLSFPTYTDVVHRAAMIAARTADQTPHRRTAPGDGQLWL
jgi:pyruvate/2-oxoglutarate dehydrogenase complex dihydrolipoamide dehydrogenase (E3) component